MICTINLFLALYTFQLYNRSVYSVSESLMTQSISRSLQSLGHWISLSFTIVIGEPAGASYFNIINQLSSLPSDFM